MHRWSCLLLCNKSSWLNWHLPYPKFYRWECDLFLEIFLEGFNIIAGEEMLSGLKSILCSCSCLTGLLLSFSQPYNIECFQFNVMWLLSFVPPSLIRIRIPANGFMRGRGPSLQISDFTFILVTKFTPNPINEIFHPASCLPLLIASWNVEAVLPNRNDSLCSACSRCDNGKMEQ